MVLRRALRHVRDWSPGLALAVSLMLGGVLGQSSLATAQPVGPGLDPGFFPATGYRIGSPTVLSYFQHHGGVRTFGYPVSNEFPLLGQRVQIFQRQMLQLGADGTVSTANILDPQVMPITHIDGLSLPPADPELLGSAPIPGSDDYATQALAFINVYVPDSWNGLDVNFQSTFLNSVTCADVAGAEPCDDAQLPVLALELWGLPTSLPTTDPLNSEFVYQRFQRGIMHFSRATGFTQGLLLGDWLKRIMIGVDLSADIGPEVRRSPFFAQYAPSRPLALDRPSDLPDTSLAQAFRADTLSAAAQPLAQVESTLPPNVASTATAVALTATAITATQVSLTGTQSVLQGTQTSLTATAIGANATAAGVSGTAAVLTATALAGQFTTTPTPLVPVSNVPVVNLGCLGDEQLWFTPRKPNIGTHVDISVTSQRHHDARNIRLTGPIDPGPVTERVGPLGFVWTWTVVPSVEAFHQWSFYADGLRPCITSGFNAFVPLGATATPTLTPIPTNTPVASTTPTITSTPTSTVVPVPVLTTATQSGTCGSVITMVGSNFGSPPSNVGTNVQLLGGPANAGTPKLLNLIGGSNTQMTATLPSAGLVAGGGYQLVVSNNGGASNTLPFTVTGTAGTTC